MPICNFFLQNRCRFGENCKFEHPRGGGGGGGGAQRNLFGGGGNGAQRSVTFRDSFGNAGNQQAGNSGSNQYRWNAGQQTQGGGQASTTTAMDMVNALPKEMDAWEKTKMWPFSCLSVEKELPCLPEFHDISVAEIRFEAYQAQKSGNMQAFNQKLQGIAQEYQTKRNQLRHMSQDVKQKLSAFIDDARKKKAQAQSMNTSSSMLGSATSSQGGQGLFGSKPANTPGSGTGLFGQTGNTGSTFGGGSGTGLFGKPAAQSSPFGSPSTTFGTPGTSSSLFGTPQRPNNPTGGTGLFGAPTQTPQGTGSSIFGQASATATPGAGLFGQQPPAATPSQGLFGNPASTPSAPTGLFGKPATATMGVPQQNNSVFGNFGNNNNSSGTGGAGLFGKPSTVGGGGSIFGQSGSTSAVPAGLFGGGQQNQTATGGGGLFGGAANNASSMGVVSASGVGGGGTGLFGKPVTAPPTGLFGQPQTTAGGVGGTGGSIFGQTGSMPAPAGVASGAGLFGKGPPVGGTASSGSTGLFGGSSGGNASTGGGGLFGSGSSVTSAAAPVGGGGSVFGGGAVQTGGSGGSGKHFSSMEELTSQDIEAFKASQFVLGNIPIKPPPRELVAV